ncbi:hypothetical protein NPIL_88761 [Nephila pilipes]|uniref:Uncharacterized protein n=1 Tax=Nephila pilipes TaxID=299642 RepID=A0A8X6N5C6_NEPPI|nr:hypothetical protein NPIL_88761 [Nephila pilipes]
MLIKHGYRKFSLRNGSSASYSKCCEKKFRDIKVPIPAPIAVEKTAAAFSTASPPKITEEFSIAYKNTIKEMIKMRGLCALNTQTDDCTRKRGKRVVSHSHRTR